MHEIGQVEKGVLLVAGGSLAVCGGLYLILSPSVMLPVALLIVGLVVALFATRRGPAPSLPVFLSLALVTVFLSALAFLLTRPISTGAEAADPLAQEIDTLLQTKSFSGAVLIAQDSHVLLNKGYGYADRSRMVANTTETRFRLGSVTKPFTAMAILLLQARGQLNVQDHIDRYLPSCPRIWSEITIHHLLTHSSGVSDYLAVCFSSAASIQQTILKARSQPLAFEPGTRFSYSNIGYRILAEIVEQASGQSFGSFLHENIFVPLGMTRTAFETTHTPGLAVGYTNALLPACPMDMSFEFGEGGINSTVEDLYRWDQALNSERLIPRPLLQRMFTVQVPMETRKGMTGGAGYGWAVGEQRGHPVQTHGGFIQGYTSVMARFPDDRMTIIILSNQQNYAESIYDLVANKLLAQP